jgi:predicted dehydrogenase
MFNIGIVGCGYWGPNLIGNFNSLSECNVKKICDLDPKRLEHLKSLLRFDFSGLVKSKLNR